MKLTSFRSDGDTVVVRVNEDDTDLDIKDNHPIDKDLMKDASPKNMVAEEED